MADSPPLWTGLLPHTCANCGLLAQWSVGSREYLSADAILRYTGKFSVAYDNVGNTQVPRELFAPWPFCIATKRNFSTVSRPADEQVRTAEEWMAILGEDMSACDGFVQWLPGLSVRDHWEMLDRRTKLKREDERDDAMRKREDERDTAMRAREDRRDQDVEQRHTEQMDTIRSQHRQTLAVLGGFVAVATLIAGMIAASWIPAPPWVDTSSAPRPVIVVTSTPISTPPS